ncbi:hypothetical protein [Roseomonas gilardii]|uniref:hypothetical protein n=1 Tax=Roseomonas gilardii TaxID=257708 RepID=UPI0004803A28|nr:hypothetical protein [Roseomonas gilardii]SUE63176.1 Uncharacterised protein [Roseomonas gilardii subsp. rosea]
MKRPNPFSLRYARPLKAGKLVVELTAEVRRRLWVALKEHNEELRVARRPGDSWTDNSDTIAEVILEMRTLLGVENLGGWGRDEGVEENIHDEARWLFTRGRPELAFDAVELAWAMFDGEHQSSFAERVNAYLDVEDCPWRLIHGELLQLDREFLGARVAETTMDGLAAGPFAGAADEFSLALRAAQAGDTKQAITEACKSFESMMKVLVGHPTASADRLSGELLVQGYLDDLPEHLRSAIRQSVLMSLPVLRNKLTAHGQGPDIVTVPPAYAALAVQLAGALNNWLLAKHAERNPAPATEAPRPADDWGDIPF